MADEPPADLFLLGPRDGFTPAVGSLASQLTVTRHYLLRASRDLDVARLDAVPPAAVNPIGAILRHLTAAERMFQVMTFAGRGFDDAERARWWPAFTFADALTPRGEGIDDLHAALAEGRAATLEGLRQRDDAWLGRPMTFFGRPANVLYYWTHYLLDEARHTGQIILLRKHLVAGGEADFQPYA
jgi:hypothetical protein